MKITIRYWRKDSKLEPDYNKRYEKVFTGNSAKECMAQITEYKLHHDCAKYTSTEIINVED